jgi:hypothetical protein
MVIISMSNCFPSFIVRWILNFLDQPTHENLEFLTTGSFPHDNFSSVYILELYQTWPHDSPVEGEKPIYFGVITIIPFDNFYRRAYFVMHTFVYRKLLKSFHK